MDRKTQPSSAQGLKIKALAGHSFSVSLALRSPGEKIDEVTMEMMNCESTSVGVWTKLA